MESFKLSTASQRYILPYGLGGIFPALYHIAYICKRVCTVCLVSSFHMDRVTAVQLLAPLCWQAPGTLSKAWLSPKQKQHVENEDGSSEESKIYRTTEQIY